MKGAESIEIVRSIENESLKPFIRWAGGKQNLIKEIFNNIKIKMPVERYFEPFLGGASFFLNGNFNKAFLSDLNPDLINCYQKIKDNPEKIFKELTKFKIPVEPDVYYFVRDEFNQHQGDKTFDQAVRFIFLNRTSFNGIYRVNASGKYNVPFGKPNPAFSTLAHLKKISEKMQKTELFAAGYEKILELVQKGDLIYLDPPYPKLSETAYFNHYTLDKFDHEKQNKVAQFANLLKDKGCKVVISNADLEEIRNLYYGWEVVECSAYRYISCKKERMKVNELIIKNF